VGGGEERRASGRGWRPFRPSLSTSPPPFIPLHNSACLFFLSSWPPLLTVETDITRILLLVFSGTQFSVPANKERTQLELSEREQKSIYSIKKWRWLTSGHRKCNVREKWDRRLDRRTGWMLGSVSPCNAADRETGSLTRSALLMARGAAAGSMGTEGPSSRTDGAWPPWLDAMQDWESSLGAAFGVEVISI
jgi:hypothetical protein